MRISASSFVPLTLLFLLPTTLALPDPSPVPTLPAAAKLLFPRAADSTPAPTAAPSITTNTCTSTGFNDANSETTVTGLCLIQACSTVGIDNNGNPTTSIGTCSSFTAKGAACPTEVPRAGKMVAAGALGLAGLLAL